MGLDQWLFRIQRLTKEEAIALEGKHYNEISEDDSLLLFRANEYSAEERDFDEIKSIFEYLTKVKLISSLVHIEDLYRDKGVPEGYSVIGSSYRNGNTHVSFVKYPEDGSDYEYSKLPKMEIDVTDEEYNKYSYEEVEDYYVCKIEEIYYWRKNYELQDKLYEAAEENGDQILNCGWHKCNEEMIMDIQDAISQEDNMRLVNMRLVLNLPESEAYVYHEWY